VGIDVARVKALHLYGGRSRVLVIDGDELRRVGNAVQFQFSKGTGGNPQYKHDGPVKANTSIDKIKTVAVYMDRDAPELKHGKLFVAGQRVDGLPYVAEERRGGTRIYLDGRFVGAVKRREVEGEGARVLSALLRSFDEVNLDQVRTAQIVVKDNIALEVEGGRLRGDSLALTAPKKSRGRFAVAGVADGAPVDAIILYAKAPLPDRDGPPPRLGFDDRNRRDADRFAIWNFENAGMGLTGAGHDIGG
jgi:hypothetical protein